VPFDQWLQAQIDNGTSQAQIARSAGIDEASISRLRRGITAPTLKTAIKLGYVHVQQRGERER
jgi:transcriptional regulator with XRE-family HTH domain